MRTAALCNGINSGQLRRKNETLYIYIYIIQQFSLKYIYIYITICILVNKLTSCPLMRTAVLCNGINSGQL